MKTACMLGLALAVGTAAHAGKSVPDVTVYLDPRGVDSAVMHDAQSLAGSMFAAIGVRVKWAAESRVPPSPAGASAVVHLRMVEQPQAGCEAPALGCAFPYADGAKAIDILYPRLKTICKSQSGLESKLLAHVMVHEIAHVLQGVSRHSETGVMKAHWTGDDYGAMRWKALPFTAHDVELIRAGIQRLR